ncbi:MAG TPA: SDR family NAD(P)-dependent oxidoreductase [Cyclobacteriaceae bacterium]|nr:SDR family NAD(P)-dependent oxidoreductase [Cyclobacteriaceae bacterium]
MKKSLYIVTGCSRGLGKALVDQLLLSGENLVVGLSRSEMEERENLLHFNIDLGDTELLVSQLDRFFPEDEFENFFLINNAGWLGEIAHLGRLDPVNIKKIHAVNVIAPAVLMNEFVKRYQKKQGTKIVVNISSGAAQNAMDGWSGYCSSKAALNQMSRVAEEESKLKKMGIKYYALSPGIIDTAMQQQIRLSDKEDFSNIEKFKSYKSDRHLKTPEEVAAKIIYLMEHSDKFKDVLQDVREF